MKKIKVFLALMLVLSACHFSKAQSDDECIAKAPSEVAVNQVFQYTITTSAKGKILDTDFGKFELVAGPSYGSSTSITMNGGKTEQKSTYSYTYSLRINKEGEFSIPGVSVSVDGKVLKSNPIVVKVLKNPKNLKNDEPNDESSSFFQFQWPDMESFFEESPFNRRKNSDKEQVEYKDDISKNDMFVKAQLSQTEAYKGEPVVVVHKLYIKKDIRNCEVVRAAFDATDAMWLEPLELNYRDEATETIKGETYHVYTIKQTAVYPKKTGKITIPKLDILLRIGVPAVVDNPFWGRMTTIRAKDFQLTSNDLALKVKSLPNSNENKTEIVGHFDISASVNKTEVYTDKAFVITVTVSGNGNLHHIEKDNINIEFPADWDIMNPKISQNISAKGNLVSGSKTFKFTLVPHSEGQYFIPGMKFTYYDDETMSYKTVTTQDLHIEVKKGKNSPTPKEDKTSKSNPKLYKI